MKDKKIVLKNLSIILTFFALSCIFMSSFIEINKFNVVSDSSFHLTRANEIYQNLKQGSLFTFIATHTFNHTGVANFLFYPMVFLYPLALLRFIFNPITSIYIWVGMFLFLTLVIAFYSMLDFSKSFFRSFLFALIYALVPYHLYLGIWNGVYGEYIAYTFIPLVFLGLYHVLWGNENRWLILSIGMTLLCLSHILSVYIATILCIILFLCKVLTQKLSAKRLINLLKSVFVTVLLAGWEFVPFLTDYLGRNIQAPREQFWFLNGFNDLVNGSFQNTVGGQITDGRTLGILLMVTFFIGIVFVRNSGKELSCYVLGTILALFSTTFVDWESLSRNTLVLNTLGNIQFPFRLLAFASFFLAIPASYIIFKVVQGLTESVYKKGLVAFVFVLISITGYFGTVQPALSRITAKNSNYLSKMTSTQKIADNVIIDKANYSNLFTGSTNTGEEDYFPKKAFKNATSILEGTVISNGKLLSYKRKFYPNMEKYFINTDKNVTVDLPIIAYRGTLVSVNGHLYPYEISQRGTVKITLKKGKNVIDVSYKASHLYYGMLIVAGITLIGIFIRSARFRDKKRADV